MRIATLTTYSQQATAIDTLEAQYLTQGNDLSTGKTLNAPSDDPSQIGEDLSVRSTIATQNSEVTNLQAATEQLTTTDTALANLTSVLQSSLQAAERGASDLTNASARSAIGGQVDEYLQQTVSLANSQYNGVYIFGGTAQSTTAPVATTGSPVSSVSFTGNEQSSAPLVFNKQSYQISPTLQQAFNYNATDGSPSVFQALISLRDTLDKGTVVNESAQQINHTGDVIYGAASPAAVRTTIGSTPSPFAVTPTPDSNGNYEISINSVDASGVSHVETYTFTGATVLDDNTATSVTGAINANSSVTGLTATFNDQTQRIVLTNAGGGSFSVNDTPSAGATDSGNLTSVLGLLMPNNTGNVATMATTVSNQIGDLQNALNVTLSARQVVGSTMNALSQINSQVTTDVLTNTNVQSGIEDTDIAKATTAFSATQTALTATYSTTTRLEAKDLFDYL
jgi:flagellar hook-associated protein 3 FlgL